MVKHSPVVFSGIRPSGRLHIGNYLGAIKQWIGYQQSNQCYFCVVDYHGITTPYDVKTYRRHIRDIVLDYLAAGLDPKQATIFIQSQVPEHTELAWIFGTLTPLAELHRMTQFKEKSLAQKATVSTGLLTYPLLMAADILLYKATVVPVGEDQVQHVELSRVIARKFNQHYGQFFPEPKAKLTAGKRIMSLVDPARKMSKSDGEKAYIALSDSPDVIRQKLAGAVTDTGTIPQGEKSPGVANLFVLLNEFAPAEFPIFEKAHAAGTIRYQTLKETLAEAIAKHFADFRTERKKLEKSKLRVDLILKRGAARAGDIANDTICDVRKKIGIR